MASAKLWLALLGTTASLGAQAGLVMTQSRTTEGGHGEAVHSVMRMSVQGDHARSDVLELSQDNPMMGTGSYVLMTAGKSELTIVKPSEKTFMRMDSRDMRGMGRLAGRMDSQDGMEVTDLKVEKKVDEAGPTMLGLPTRHLVYEISYSRPVPKQAIKVSNDIKETRELWVTKALEAKVAPLTQFKSFSEGMGSVSGSMAGVLEVDKQLRAEGFALKSVTTTESKMNIGVTMLNPATMLAHGRGGSSRTVMELTELKEDDLPAQHFAVPSGFSEREMMNPNAGAMPDLNKLMGSRGSEPGKEPAQMPDLNNIPGR
jgi:hypothetical protein